jgi:aminoglycoside 6-adenylyltransferase
VVKEVYHKENISKTMNQITQTYQQIIEKFIQWAQGEDGIRAVAMIGSRARADHPADAWADLDLIVVAADPVLYLSSADWLHQIALPWLTFIESSGDGRVLERRVLFEGGLDVDFAFLPLEMATQMAQSGFPPDVADMFRRGVRVLLDKDDLFTSIPELAGAPLAPAEPPTQEEFLNLVNDFWYHTVWSAKHLRRGELWWGKSCVDDHLKFLLRRMLEWHARLKFGPQHDTWLRGRFLEEWADPRAVQELRQAFAHYDATDIWRALFATMHIFRWVSHEAVEQLGYAYPRLGEQAATELVNKMFETSGARG